MTTPTPPTDAELLVTWRLAVDTALRTGQAVSFNGRTWQSHDLGDLIEYGRQLEIRTQGTSARTRVAAYCKGV